MCDHVPVVWEVDVDRLIAVPRMTGNRCTVMRIVSRMVPMPACGDGRACSR
jgi:hypothetical protein